MKKVRDEIDERLYCNGPPVSTATPQEEVPTVMEMKRVPTHIEIVDHHPENKYQLQWIRGETDPNMGMYWNIDNRPFNSTERYRNWLETGIAESDRERDRQKKAEEFFDREYDKPEEITPCHSEKNLWIGAGICISILALIISQHQLGWIPQSHFIVMPFYALMLLIYAAPVLFGVLGIWGIKSYCNPDTCDRDSFNLMISLVLLTISAGIIYIIITGQEAIAGHWKIMDGMLERLKEI